MNNTIFNKLRKGTCRKGQLTGPFGIKPIVYADSTASGIVYEPITKYMNDAVLPFYSNTHSNAICGKYMSELIDYTKKMIRKEYNCDEDADQIIFTGNGCSGAIMHLIHAMDLKKNANQQNIVVFVSVTEHHSNYLPWKHLPYTIELVPIREDGRLDQDILFEKLNASAKKGAKIIASFSGASNVSGIIEDWSTVSIMVHSFNGIMLWDMAACAPYVKINMHKNNSTGDYMDAIFLSPHKFLGGPGCPGLLIAHKKLFVNEIPFCPGGGTVRFVCKKYQIYNPNIEIKETGGTPNILGCIQLGKVYEIKMQLQEYIDKKEHLIYEYVYKFLLKIPNLILIRPKISSGKSLPIFSFIISNYHCNLVVVLLNDLFGIQSRGGVSCCSVFAQNILHLDEKEQEKIYFSIRNGKGVPANYGWCRISFHYIMTREEVKYILYAILLISKYIEKLSQFYEYEPKNNNWVYKGNIWKSFQPSNRLLLLDKNYTCYDLSKNMQETKYFLSTL